MTKLKPKDMAQVLFELTDGKNETEIAQIIPGYVAFLGKKRMLGTFPEIAEHYRAIYNKAHNITEATVTLISRLSENDRLALREALKKKYHAREVHMLEKVDARLLGGMKVRIGDMVYDASLQNTLAQLETKLTA